MIDDSGAARAVDTSHGRVRAHHEVILCCGAFDSPCLSLLWGIGPSDHLRDIGIDVVHELPAVGEHLVDHPDSVLLLDAAKHVPGLASQGWEQGSSHGRPDLAAPDVMYHCGTIPTLNTAPAGYPTTDNGFSINPSVMRPASRGVVRLRSASHPSLPCRSTVFTHEGGCDLSSWSGASKRDAGSQHSQL